MITEQDVIEYRDLYYGIVKPLLMKFASEDEISAAIIAFGWEPHRFRAFQMLDLAQRMNKLSGKTGRMINVEGISSILAGTQPELKCPIRTTQID